MTLQSSGQIKFSDITAEFGQPSGKNIGAYRVSQNIGSLTNLPLDTGVPQSGQISFSNFHGKEANIIVDCHSSGSSNYNQDAYRNRFATGNFNVVGGFRTSVPKSAWQGGKTVIININKTFSSSGASSRNHFALEVGRYNNNNSQHGWPTSTELSVVVGSQGSVVGKGGNGGSGGYGGNAVLNAGNGGEGTSALKIHSGMSISGESRIRGGGGGGGGGLGITGYPESDDEPDLRAFGGGGGGGAGIPTGTGGTTQNNSGSALRNHNFEYHAFSGTVGSPDVTKTFSSSNVSWNVNDDHIQINSHGFQRGQRVRYSNGGGSNIGGLSNNQIYYVVPYYYFYQATQYIDNNRIKLATSELNSYKEFTINFTSAGSSSSQSLTRLGGTGGPGARIVTDTDESDDVDAYILMGEGGNGGTSPSGGGNGSSGQGGSNHYSYHHGGGTSWVEEFSSASTGSGGNGGYRYVTY